MSITRHHSEWLSLLDISGPFLSLKVLAGAFPQGLDAPDADVARELRLAYDEWLDSAFGNRPDPELHRAWVEWVLRRVLAMPGEVLVRDSGLGTRDSEAPDDGNRKRLTVHVPEHGETLQPTFIIAEPAGSTLSDPESRTPRLLVQIVPPGQDLEKAPAKAAWQASPATRMMTLLRGAGVRLGVLTNGEQWMLVDRPADENVTTGFASWYARLWLDEPLTLRAFRTLLGAHRLFGVPDNQTLEALLTDSANDRQEVTDQLGYQVRRAVELLVQAIDLADQNEGRKLLVDLPEERLYEAALTVMMRLVFLLFAEEQNLLLLGDDIYDSSYAVSTLLEALREAADRHGEEVLERSYDAWARLLAIFRAVYGGFSHDRLTMPAYGGGLFNPDRFAFLEGRPAAGIGYRVSGIGAGAVAADEMAFGTRSLESDTRIYTPLPISNRVVLHLLEALQVLRVKIRDGQPVEARRLSFRSLDIEQIGHVYEGLLDHTAVRAPEPVLGLAGTRDREPEVALARLEELGRIGDPGSGIRDPTGLIPHPESRIPDRLLAFLVEETGRSANALKKAWAAPLDAFRATLLRAACGNDEALYARVLPFAGLVRDDDYGRPIVIPAGSVYVTSGTERRATGTHYTPRSLTEPIVLHTLEPLVFHGPAEGLPREGWTLRPAADLLQLTVCDMAMGSGAFLVQACRYLSERLLEAWAAAETGDPGSGIREAATREPGAGIREAATTEVWVGDGVDGADTDLSGSGRLAEGHGPSGADLSADTKLPEGGAVRADEPDPARSGVGPGEHRGRLRPYPSQGVHPPPVDRTRLAVGSGDAASASGAPELLGQGAGASDLVADPGRRHDAQSFNSDSREEADLRGLAGNVGGAHSRIPDPGSRKLITPDGFLATDPNDAIPADPDERLVLARRLVADRCLYGVDKNPLAVEMAKLSLWLITLAKGQPFSFLDHALRCGDSLLGISDLGQLTHWSLAKSGGAEPRQASFITWQVEEALEVALRERRKIAGTRVREARDADLKAGWLATADAAMALVRLGADLLVASALHPNPKRREGLRNEWLARYSLLLTAAGELRGSGIRDSGSGVPQRAGAIMVGSSAEQAGRSAYAELRREADELLAGRKPFHWPLEFPEVFAAGFGIRDSGLGTAGFEALLAGARSGSRIPDPESRDNGFAAVVGNPPFQGGQKITGALGVPYRDYLVEHLAGGQRGSADLCAYFFLRAGEMLQPGGQTGLLATNTIAQGDTREVGLDQLVAGGFAIPRAVPSRPWPGMAAVEVAHVWLRRGPWRGPFALDEQPVTAISPFLTVPGAASGNPYRLKANEDKSFIGSLVLGMGFVLEPEEAAELIERDPRNRDVLFPYLNGEDLNSRPDQSPSRWVINFRDWPLDRAESYPDLMAIVREKVKPERDKVTYSKSAREYWWQYERGRPELYATIAGMERVLATALVSKYVNFVFQPADIVFMHKLAIFPFDSGAELTVLQSTLHMDWAWHRSSTLGGSTINYSPSDCFETFPFPWKEPADPGSRIPDPELEAIGETYHAHRKALMADRNEGLTKTYNRFHSPDEASEDIAELRRLHVAMDQAVAAAYGWADLDLGHGFHQTKQGLRYTISEPARREVLDRLLALNHERYAEEVRQGLHEKKSGSGSRVSGSGKRGRPPKASDPGSRIPDPEAEQGTLF